MNKALAIRYLFPDADPLKDFEVWDDGLGNQQIGVWNIDAPQPTEAELQAAWEAYEALPIPPTPKTPDQLRIEQLETQLAQQNADNITFTEFILQTLGVE